MKATLCALAVFLLMIPASAQNSIQGAWSGEVQANGSTQLIEMAIRVDDDRVSGSIVGAGSELSIKDATLSANSVEFTSVGYRDGAELKFHWTGAINGDEISFTVAAEGSTETAMQVVVRRQPN